VVVVAVVVVVVAAADAVVAVADAAGKLPEKTSQPLTNGGICNDAKY
jgi:hypothetical protein